MNRLSGTKAATFVFTFFLAISTFLFPSISSAGLFPTSPATDVRNFLLVGYWDLRERESFFQVTNVTGEAQRVHIQIYDASNNCVEFDYYDTLTPRDTHVYNLAELDRNNGVALSAPDLSGGHGIVSVMQVENDDRFSEAVMGTEPALTGNFTIQDHNGYQYRNNLAGSYVPLNFNEFRVNFNDVSNASFADLVAINLDVEDDPGRVIAVPQIYEITLYDEDENPISCSPALLGCFSDIEILSIFEGFSETHVNVGINQAVTNSRGNPSVCLGNDTTGYLELTPTFIPADLQFIFIGLNNDNGTGSMIDATVIPSFGGGIG